MKDDYSDGFPEGTIPQRNDDQSMGLWLNESSLLEPEKIDRFKE